MSDVNPIPDQTEMQRIGQNINRAREMIPDRPDGLKVYIGQWILPTMAQMFKQVLSLAAGNSYSLGGLQQLSAQVQMLTSQEGIMEIAGYVAGLQEVLGHDEPNMEGIRNTVSAMALVLEERFMLNLGGDFDDEDFDDEEVEAGIDGNVIAAPVETAPTSVPPAPVEAASAPTPVAPTPAATEEKPLSL